MTISTVLGCWQSNSTCLSFTYSIRSLILSYAALHSSPELVASATGYVISTPSSMQAGMRGRAKKPNRQREKAMLMDWFCMVNTCKHN